MSRVQGAPFSLLHMLLRCSVRLTWTKQRLCSGHVHPSDACLHLSQERCCLQIVSWKSHLDACRVGEADDPGPHRIRLSLLPFAVLLAPALPPLPSAWQALRGTQPLLMLTRLAFQPCLKACACQPSFAAPPSSPTVPALEPCIDASLQGPAIGDAAPSGDAASPSSMTSEQLRQLLRVGFDHKLNGKPAWATCCYVQSKATWRWQCRAKPGFAGVERKSACSALRGWLKKNEEHICDHSIADIEQQILTLQEYEHLLTADVRKQWQDTPLQKRCERSVTDPSVPEHALDEQFVQLAAANIPMERWIPQSVGLACADLIADILHHHADNRSMALHVLYLPKLVWHAGHRSAQGHCSGRMRQKHVFRRIELVKARQWQQLFTEAMSSALPVIDSPSGISDDVKNANSLMKAAQNGNPVKAWRLLESPGLCEPSPATWETITSMLSPHADVADVSLHEDSSTSGSDLCSVKDLDAKIQRMRGGKAIDSCGWSHEAMQQIWACEMLRPQLQRWLLFRDGEDRREASDLLLFSSKVVQLKKSKMGGVRPILLQPNWKKLYAGVLAKHLLKLSADWLPHTQTGLGISNGTSLTHGMVQSFLQGSSTPVVVKVDVQNAFGSMWREAALQRIAEHMTAEQKDQWMRVLTIFLRQPIVVMPTHEPDGQWHASFQGFAQGDPLSTWIFSTALSLTLQQHLTDGCFCPYVDDTIIFTEAAAVDKEWLALKDALASLGLTLQCAKTSVYTTDLMQAVQMAPILASEVPNFQSNGLLLCGHCLADITEMLTLGMDQYVSDHLRCMARQLADSIARMLSYLPLLRGKGKQVVSRLLRATMPSRFIHLLRSNAARDIAEFLETVDDTIKTAWAALLGVSSFAAPQWALACLPTYREDWVCKQLEILHASPDSQLFARCPKSALPLPTSSDALKLSILSWSSKSLTRRRRSSRE